MKVNTHYSIMNYYNELYKKGEITILEFRIMMKTVNYLYDKERG